MYKQTLFLISPTIYTNMLCEGAGETVFRYEVHFIFPNVDMDFTCSLSEFSQTTTWAAASLAIGILQRKARTIMISENIEVNLIVVCWQKGWRINLCHEIKPEGWTGYVIQSSLCKESNRWRLSSMFAAYSNLLTQTQSFCSSTHIYYIKAHVHKWIPKHTFRSGLALLPLSVAILMSWPTPLWSRTCNHRKKTRNIIAQESFYERT